MPNPKTERPAAPRRHQRRRDATHERLIQAALELLSTGGEAAVSTVSVTRGAGIVQSGFYQHFRNIDACLAMVADRAGRHIRETVGRARREMYENGPGAGPDLEDFYRTVLGLASRERPMMELFLRYRTDPLALNGMMHRLAGELRADLAQDLTEQVKRAGAKAIPPTWVQATADHLMAASWSAIEAEIEGRGLGAEESARLLAAFSTGACLGVLGALQGAAGRNS